MIKLTLIDFKDNVENFLLKKSFYDSCVGSGGVLTFANKELKEKELNTNLEFYGQEINATSYALCKANLLINGLESRNIELGNSLLPIKLKKMILII